MKKQTWVGLAAILTLSAAASAAVPWTVPAGAFPTYTYDGGQTDNGKLGSATATEGHFVLSPNHFVAGATGATPNVSVTDTATVNVHVVNPLAKITGVEVTLLGDYSILGTGSVNAFGTLTITDLNTSSSVTSPLIATGVPVSTTTSADGGFSLFRFELPASILPTSPVKNLKLDFTATLNATAGSNGVSLIEAKDAEIKIWTAVPEPTALFSVSLAGLMLKRSRK